MYHHIPYLSYLLCRCTVTSGTSSATGTTASAPSTQPVPVASGQPSSTQFKVQNSIYKKKASPQVSTVESEFRKYVSGPLSSEETNILQFWEVRILWLTSIMTHSQNRPIGPNFWHCLWSQWTISQSRQHPYLMSECSHQWRRQTPQNKTRSAWCSWRPFNYSSSCWNKNA